MLFFIIIIYFSGSYLAIKWAIRSFKNNYLLQSKEKYFCMKKLEHFFTIQQTADEASEFIFISQQFSTQDL
jgi:hypothetical protein